MQGSAVWVLAVLPGPDGVHGRCETGGYRWHDGGFDRRPLRSSAAMRTDPWNMRPWVRGGWSYVAFPRTWRRRESLQRHATKSIRLWPSFRVDQDRTIMVGEGRCGAQTPGSYHADVLPMEDGTVGGRRRGMDHFAVPSLFWTSVSIGATSSLMSAGVMTTSSSSTVSSSVLAGLVSSLALVSSSMT